MFVPSLMVANAKADVGFREGPNDRNPYSFWQYGNYNQPYCDSAVCYWAWHAGFRFNGSDHGDRGYSWVTAHRRAAQAQNIWRDRSTIARPNWLVVFSFTEPDQHIEMVLSDQGGSVATIGGNTSDRVAYRVRSRRNVVGFVALDEAGQNAPSPTPQPTEEVMERTVKPAGGDKALNIVSAAKIVWTSTSLTVAATGDCTITPVGFAPDKTQEIVRSIKKPLFGVFDHGNDPKLAYGEFVIAGGDKREFKFTVS